MLNKIGMLIAATVAVFAIASCDKQEPTSAGTDTVVSSNSSMGEISWISQDYKQALAKADTDGKLLMVDVYTTWCGPCKMMDKDTFPNKSVVDKAANFVTLKLDAEKGQGPAVAKQFQVEGFPTILFIDGKGKLVHSILGYHDAAALVAEMDKALDKIG